MTLKVFIQCAASGDIDEAHAWYETQQKGLGKEFLNEIEAGLTRIADWPENYPEVLRDARRAPIRRFPYSIYFRVRGTEARILAVIHQSRDPRVWQRRLR